MAFWMDGLVAPRRWGRRRDSSSRRTDGPVPTSRSASMKRDLPNSATTMAQSFYTGDVIRNKPCRSLEQSQLSPRRRITRFDQRKLPLRPVCSN